MKLKIIKLIVVLLLTFTIFTILAYVFEEDTHYKIGKREFLDSLYQKHLKDLK